MKTTMPLSGSQEFIDRLLSLKFASPNGYVDILDGCELSGHSLECSGFKKPILIRKKDGLRIVVPDKSFTVQNLFDYINPEHLVDVIDVRAQEEIQMNLKELVTHFNKEPRTMLLNMLSLEFSNTGLSALVNPPHLVSELSLITNCWTNDSDEVDDGLSSVFANSTPSVQRYCLLSMAGSYTDFHIDFGGSSVWYHILWGEKIFYLIPPTEENCHIYWTWSWNSEHKSIFLPDLMLKDTGHAVEKFPGVYCLTISAGETILLPSGWIHAVYTVTDCLVFGGNFLNELHIPMQLAVYRMEQKCGTPRKFQFPNFEKVHWFVTDRLVGRLTNTLYNDQLPSTYELEAARSLSKVLPRWLEKRRNLPPDERSYYLPHCSTLDLSWSQLITRLRELVFAFSPPSSPAKIRSLSKSDDSTTEHKLAKSSTDADMAKSSKSHRRAKQRKKSSKQVHSDSPVKDVFNAIRRPSGSKRKAKKLSNKDDVSFENPDVLDAVPELGDSRLIGDHYYLTFSDSDREDLEDAKRLSTTTTVSNKRTTRDPDPTWSVSGTAHRKSTKRCVRSPNSLLLQSQSRIQSTALSLSGGQLHPLLDKQSSSPSVGPQAPNVKPSVSDNATKKVKRPKSVHTTARQRLAKRLGL